MKNYLPFTKWITCFALLFFCVTRSFGYDLVVAQDGSGNYTTVQAAINAAPSNLTSVFTIYIKNGTYNEVVNIPSTKPFLQLIGQSVANTIIQFNNSALTIVNGGALGTAGSATLTIGANDCSFLNLTVKNTYGDGSQAVAVEINADRVAFKNCRFMGNQDTLYTKGTGNPRHYFRNCYIDGNVDFIFGSSIDIFDSCVVYAKTRTTSGVSYCTAANTTAGQLYGYIFRNCILPANTLGTSYYLGRPWQNATGFTPTSSTPQANNKVAYINCTLGAHINPAGWVIWDAGTDTTKITDVEYQSKNFNGSLTDVSQRVTWSQQLNSTQAAAYAATSTIFSGWDPCPVIGCGAFTPDIAVSNFAGVKGAIQSTFTWNISWPIAGVTYNLYRSTDSINYSLLTSVTAANDTNVNFQLTDNIPPQGSVYYYYIQATKTGLATDITDTVVISSAPTIILTGTPGILTQYLGTPSGGSPYAVSGTNLSANVIVTPPANFEISSDGGITWHNSTSPITLAETAGVLASTNILVRLNATANGTYTGNILHTTTGGLPKFDSVSGITSDPPAYTETVLEEWPFTTNNLDSTAVRAQGITATVPVMQHLYLSNGTTVTTIPAYSPTFGEAFGSANATGDGTWSASSGGTGGTLQRTIYQQFTITPGANYTARVDSFILNAAFNGSSSGTSMMVVYSKSNFVSDSTNIYGYGFATSGGAGVQDITLPNQTAGPAANWRLGLVGGGSGVTLNHGDTLTIRVYFTCSSSSAGRYATVLDVLAKGFTTALPAVLEEWPFTTNNIDSAAVRAIGVTPTVPTLNNLYTSTGTPAAYTPAFGQALSAGATGGATAGDGHWSTATGGPGGNLLRTYYEQFTLTPAAHYSMRVDSFILNAGFDGTSSSTTMMVVYSKSNFVSDSTNVNGYGFATTGGAGVQDITLPNQTSSNTANWRLGLLNTAAGVTVNPGQTLSFRVYFTCSSSSAAKYAELLNVYAKGITTALPCPSQPGTIVASIPSICAGQTNAVYTVPNDTSVTYYTWSFSGTGATYTSTTNSVSVNYANNATSGILSVNANATCGTSAPSNLPVVVNALPADSITTAVAIPAICAGDSLTLNANTGTNYFYQWSLDSNNIANATAANLVVYAAGNYTVSITNSNGCTATSPVLPVTISAAPVATITTPSSATVYCPNGSLVLSANTGTAYTYQWQNNGTNINVTSATDTVNADGSYSVVVTNGAGCTATSTALTVTVATLPADTVSAVGSVTFCAGNSVVLNASTVSGAGYQWLNNGAAIAGATTGSYTATTSGQYAVIVTGATCTDTSAATQVTAHPLPIPVITENSRILSAGTFTTYQWKFNGASVATSSTLDATTNGNGIYTVTVTDGNGCSNTSVADTVTDVEGVVNISGIANAIRLYPNPATDIVYIDAPVKVNISIAATDGRLILQKNNAKDISISNLASGIYMILVYDENNTLIKTNKLVKN